MSRLQSVLLWTTGESVQVTCCAPRPIGLKRRRNLLKPVMQIVASIGSSVCRGFVYAPHIMRHPVLWDIPLPVNEGPRSDHKVLQTVCGYIWLLLSEKQA